MQSELVDSVSMRLSYQLKISQHFLTPPICIVEAKDYG